MNFCQLNILFYLLHLSSATTGATAENFSYINYHKQTVEAEGLIFEKKYGEALYHYEKIFNNYAFVFLRDYKIASQLALFTVERETAFKFIKEGIVAGWELKALITCIFLASLRIDPGWKVTENEYDARIFK
jgi:hypothetical protein